VWEPLQDDVKTCCTNFWKWIVSITTKQIVTVHILFEKPSAVEFMDGIRFQIVQFIGRRKVVPNFSTAVQHIYTSWQPYMAETCNIQGLDKNNGSTKKLRNRICVGSIERISAGNTECPFICLHFVVHLKPKQFFLIIFYNGSFIILNINCMKYEFMYIRFFFLTASWYCKDFFSWQHCISYLKLVQQFY
jgi:hypothetical protein